MEKKQVKKVAVVGAGNGGITAAADLTDRGFQVALTELPKFSAQIEKLQKLDALILHEPGKQDKSVKIHQITSDLEEAVKGADIVMLTITGSHAEVFAEALAPVLEPGQCVLINSAAAMCARRFELRAKQIVVEKKFSLCEFNTLTYATRATPDTGEIDLSLRVKNLFFAALDTSQNKELYDLVSQIYPETNLVQNSFEVLFHNGNPDVHPGPALLSAGRVEYSGGEFWLYREAITEHTYNVMLRVDDERRDLAKAFGFDLEPMYDERVARGYVIPDKTKPRYKHYNESPVFSRIKGPANLESRYFSEETTGSLALWVALGRACGVFMPVSEALITLTSALLDRNLEEESLSLKDLGYQDLTPEQLKNVFK